MSAAEPHGIVRNVETDVTPALGEMADEMSGQTTCAAADVEHSAIRRQTVPEQPLEHGPSGVVEVTFRGTAHDLPEAIVPEDRRVLVRVIPVAPQPPEEPADQAGDPRATRERAAQDPPDDR